MRALLLLMFLWLGAAPTGGLAQSTYEELAAVRNRPQFYHEAFALPSPGAPALVVAFRIPNSLLVFVQDRGAASEHTFTARTQLAIQILQDGRVVAEQKWHRDHYAATFEETQHGGGDLEGAVRFSLAPGTYAYRLVLGDDPAGPLRPELQQQVTLPSFDGLHLGRAVFVHRVQPQADVPELSLINLGGNVAFGAPAHALVPVGLPPGGRPEEAVLQYTLLRLDEEAVRAEDRRHARRQAALAERQRARPAAAVAPPPPAADPEVLRRARVAAAGTVEGSAFLPAGQPSEAAAQSSGLPWPAPAPDTAGYLAPIDLNGLHLEAGAYVLDVVVISGGRRLSAQTPFRTHWRGMPVSLYSSAVAIRNLSYIEDRKTIRAMLRGSRREQERRLHAYWKERDPTPGTVFNELMAEYYRRIDRAASAFSTGTQAFPDGLRSDQARIYVVHGPPPEVERALSDQGGVEETWTYPDGRRFVFRAASSLEAFRLRPEDRE